MTSLAVWITGPSRSGKTTRLLSQVKTWLEPLDIQDAYSQPGILAFAATGDHRLELTDRLAKATQGSFPVRSTTPLGFFEDEVLLFWSLLADQLDLQTPFPLRLAPETELEFATQLWQPTLDPVVGQQGNVLESRLVRQVLDFLQLGALAGIGIADIPHRLEQGFAEQAELPLPTALVGTLLEQWQTWCLERGLLTYGLITALYGQQLLPDPIYRQHLIQRFGWLVADDVDEYPAIAGHLFKILMQAGLTAAFTYNPNGAVRLGLGADPDAMADLSQQCLVESLSDHPVAGLAAAWGSTVVDLSLSPFYFTSLPDCFQVIQTGSRGQMLNRATQALIAAIQQGQVQPQDVAMIAPGLDAIARYTVAEQLHQAGIGVESLNDQRPLNSVPMVRALLTLIILVYPGLGRLAERESVAELLVVLSQPEGAIDPVRAGLLADYCFAPHPERPQLLPAQTFSRWDRLGYQATTAYEQIQQWIATQQTHLEQRLLPNFVSLLDRAIQHFFLADRTLTSDQLAALRQLMETAQHYWDVSRRVQGGSRFETPAFMTASRLIQLLRSGAITANPYPMRLRGAGRQAVTLATVFQYRSSRRAHRWQFWLDTGSPRWLSGVDGLVGAPLFLQGQMGRPWTAMDAMESNEQRLRRILLDLLGRTEERVFLCHSDLATDGQEQTGVLLSLVNAAVPLESLQLAPDSASLGMP